MLYLKLYNLREFTQSFYIVTSGWTSWSEYSACIQQEWGTRACTRARVKICMGTLACHGEDKFGTMSEIQNCKTDPQLSATCSSKNFFFVLNLNLMTHYQNCFV